MSNHGLKVGQPTAQAQLAAATGDIAVNSQKLTLVGDPVSAQDAATKAYVDSVAQGLDIKQSVRVIATTNLVLSGTQTIDGVAVIAGDRVLASGQTAGAENGPYVVAAGAWSRATDANTSAKVTSGLFVWVDEGTVGADSGWVLTTNDPIVLNTTVLVFTKFSGLGQITAGNGLSKTGNTLSAAADADASIVVAVGGIKVGVLATDAQHGNRGGGALHANAVAGGAAGFLTGADQTKLDGVEAGAQVTSAARVLTALAAAASDIAVNAHKITGLADPSLAQDAATKAYVDALQQGLDIKASVRAVATSNITLSGTQTIDGVAVIAGDRVLCAGQTSGLQNGIYVVAAGAWARSTDADSSAKVTGGMYAFVSEGTVNADSGWALTTNDPIVLNTTALVFTQFSGAGQITAGNGLSKSGNTLSAAADADASIAVGSGGIKVGVLATDAQHGNRGGGALHANAVAGGAAGFLTGAGQTKLDSLVAGQAATVGALTVDAILETPTSPAFASSLALDVSIKNDFTPGLLTGNVTFTFSNAAPGRQGFIIVKQDGTGGRTVTFTAPATYTIITNATDLVAAAGANLITQYAYAMYALGGTNYLQIGKALPV